MKYFSSLIRVKQLQALPWLKSRLDSLYRIGIGTQIGEILAVKEEKKVKFAFLQLLMPGFLQGAHTPFTNTPTTAYF